ncbi:MAG: CHAT domain-containing tetratricopeptide repeat protein [Thermodesulfobacteriota bacterium]
MERNMGAAFLLLALFLSSVPACKTAEVSVQEARKITAGFKGVREAAPPRGVEDIVASVQAPSGGMQQGMQDALAILKDPVPQDAPAEALSSAYARRGFAARRLSRDREAIQNFGLAASYADRSPGMNRLEKAWCHFQHGWSLFVGGNLLEALRAAERVTAMIPPAGGFDDSETHWREQGHLLAWEGFLASFYAVAGDLDAAEKALARCLQIRGDFLFASRRWPAGSVRPYEAGVMDAGVALGKAMVLDLRGRHGEAEKHHTEAIGALVSRMGWQEWKWIPRNQMEELFRGAEIGYAANLRDQGRFEEAESLARANLGESLKVLGRYSPHPILALNTLSTIFLAQGRFADVESLCRLNLKSLEHATAAADSMSVIMERRLLAQALAGQGRWDEALREYGEISRSLKESPDWLRRFLSRDPMWAMVLMKAGDPREALRAAEASVDEASRLYGKARYEAAEAEGVRAMVLSVLGRGTEALEGLRSALGVLVEARRKGDEGAASSSLRVQRFALMTETCAELLDAARQGRGRVGSVPDPVGEIFRLTELARGSAVREALAASATRAAFGDSELARLIRSEQDAQKEIVALFNLLSHALDASKGRASQKAVDDLRTRISNLRAARRALLEEINRRSAGYMEMINPSPPTFKTLQATLRPQEAMLSIYAGERSSYVWAIPKAGEPSFAAVPVGRREIHERVTGLRKALDPSATTLDQIPPFDLELAYKIYGEFLHPVIRGWDGVSTLFVVANGPFGFLPFSLLPTSLVSLPDQEDLLFSRYRRVHWLARKTSISTLPSAASLVSLRNLPPGNAARKPFVGFGDPDFGGARGAVAYKPAEAAQARGVFQQRAVRSTESGSLDNRGIKSVKLPMLQRLPETADEIRSIALSLGADPEKDVFVGSEAGEQRIKSMILSDRRVVAFATHALMPGDLDGLWQPALALSAPRRAGDQEDGLLTMGEVLGLKLDADWVVLSACNTGAGGGVGEEAVSGLGSAFFYAGTRALLVTNWPVETASALALTTELFRRQAADVELGRSKALQQAMLELIDRLGAVGPDGKMLFTYAHPVFWAPFTLVGDG